MEPDVALECTGTEGSVAASTHAVRFGGSTVVVVGVGENGMKLPLMRLSTREVSLRFQYPVLQHMARGDQARRWRDPIKYPQACRTCLLFRIQDVIEAFNTNIYIKSGAMIRLSKITNKDQIVGGAVGACVSIPF